MFTQAHALIFAFCVFIVFATTAAFRWEPFSLSHDEQRSVELVLIFVIGLVCLLQMLHNFLRPKFALTPLPVRVLVALGVFFGLGLASASLAALPA